MKLSPHHYLSPLSYPPRYEASLAIGRAIRDPAKRAKIEGPAAANVATLRERLGETERRAFFDAWEREARARGGAARGPPPEAGAGDACACAVGGYFGALCGVGGAGADASDARFRTAQAAISVPRYDPDSGRWI